jgi:hypothetical protein
MSISPDSTIQLHLDEAGELVDLLRGLEDWLGHAGAGTYEEITDFYNGADNGRLAVAGLIALLGNHAHTLNHRLKETTR